MTSPAHGPRQHPLARLTGSWPVRLLAAGSAVAITATAVVAAGPGSAGAASARSNASARFLSGTIGGTNLDTVAGVAGEKASSPGDPGPNSGTLEAELLKNAIDLKLGDALHLPDPTGGAIQLGAVAQYAKATDDGSAIAASGAVDSNGGVAVGGSDGVPEGGATVDLSGSTALSAITDNVANLKLTVGALTARAEQVALGKKTDDTAKDCTSGGYARVSNADQTGTYKIAGLGVDLTSPLLSRVATTLTGALKSVLTTANITDVLTVLNGSPLGDLLQITVPDTSTLLDGLLKLDLADGAITVDLEAGSLHVDLAKLLSFLHLDINTLCPNTSLLPYIVQALTSELPDALDALVTSVSDTITNAVKGVDIKLLNVDLTALLSQLITNLTGTLTGAASTLLGDVDTSALDPLLTILDQNLLSLTANPQSESDGTFHQGALAVDVLPGGGAATLPTIPGLPSLPGVPNATALRTAAKRAVAEPAAAPAASSSAVHLALANASVGPSSAITASTSPNSSSPSTTAASTGNPSTDTSTGGVVPNALPTGVPAGKALVDQGPSTWLVLLALLGVAVAGGASFAQYRTPRPRGRHGR